MRVSLGALILTAASSLPVAAAGDGGSARLSERMADSIGVSVDLIPIASHWLYQPGDSAAWADPAADDSDWELTSTTLVRDSMPASGWTGIGWFRLHVVIDSALIGVPLSARLAQTGAAELYLDGERVHSGGRIGRSAREEELYLNHYPDPMILSLKDTAAVFAVRYSNHSFERVHRHAEPAGFLLELADGVKRIATSSRVKLFVRAYQWGFTGACSVLALVFLLVYAFSRQAKQDLFLALLAAGCALLSYAPFELYSGVSLSHMILAVLLFKLALIMVAMAGLRFLYELFYTKLPRQFWFFLSVGLVLLPLAWTAPMFVFFAYVLLALIEMLRVVVVAVASGRQGATTIAIGFSLFVIGCVYQIIMDWQWVPRPPYIIMFPYMVGILALLVAASLHLARQFALTNAELSQQLSEVQRLSEATIQQEVARELLQKDIEHKEEQLREAARLEQALSELEAAHSQLQQADERLRTIIDASPVPLVVTRVADGLIIYANSHLGRLIGYTVEELEGQRSPDFYHDPQDRREVVERLERDGLIDNHEVRIRHRDGSIVWCLFSLVTSRIGDDDVIIGGLYDISERKAAEEKLKLYRRIFDNTQDGIMVFDTHGQLILRNPAHRRLSGLQDKDVAGKSVLDLVPETARNAIRKGLESGNTFRGEFEWPPVGGKERPIDLSVFTIRDADGQVVYSVGMGRDVSERRAAQRAMQTTMEQLRAANAELKNAQTQLVQSEKMASLGLLVAGIAHEINTPVGAINSMHDTLVRAVQKLKGMLSSCALAAADVERIQPTLKAIDEANRVIDSGTERVTTIVRRLRSFARLDEAELKAVDLHEGIEDTLTLIHHEIKNRIRVVRNFGDIPPVTCYPGRLNQVFLNLLNNARQAIDGEGVITIETSGSESHVSIRFTDTGGGIAKADLERIFDPGFTTKGVRVGTGLGLSICYQIVEDHRGRIEVESELGKGTTFTVVLPLDLEEQLERASGR
jgi:PAS domain S-box-containing protein